MFNPAFKIDSSFKDFAAIRHWSESYHLSLLIRPTGLQYAIIDPAPGKFIALEEASLKSTAGPADFPGLFQQYLAGEEWAGRVYGTVRIGFETPWTTLIPAGLFDPLRLSDFLGFNFHLPADTVCKADHLQAHDCYNVWGADPTVLSVLARRFPNASLWHHASVLASRLPLAYPPEGTADRIFIARRRNRFDLLIFHGNRLAFINAFSFQSSEDILYYLLFVFEQKQVDAQNAAVIMLGDQPGEQDLNLLRPYFPGLILAGKPSQLKASSALEGLPWPQYFTLAHLHLCE